MYIKKILQMSKVFVSIYTRCYCASFVMKKRNSSYLHSINRYRIHVLPALTDNYMYVLIDKYLKIAIAVDPVEPDKVLNLVSAENVNLNAVLTTHHHFDHAGGNKIISTLVKNLPIYGFDERIDSLTEKVCHNQIVKIGDLNVKCLHTPCHTSGHICYFLDDENLGPTCFTGDTLFIAGCGKFFEGTANDMFQSLNLLALLPPNTKCYCGHEYTMNNLKFALSVDPENQDIVKKIKLVTEKISNNKPSVPTTIQDELNYNPFLRVKSLSIQKHVREIDPISVMGALRKLKDNF